MPTGIHEVHERTKVLASYLAEQDVGHLATYDEIAGATKLDVREQRNRGYFVTARRIEERAGRVWETVRGSGVILRDDTEAVTVVEGKVRNLQRATGRTRRTLQAVNTENLAARDLHRFATMNALTGIVRGLFSKRGRKRLLADVEKASGKSMNNVGRRVLDKLLGGSS